jgi:molybdenum cofactor cytidylyltransferase
MRNLAVLVLAAGASSRMLTPKQLLKIGDQTLLEVVLEKATAISSVNVICVLGANAELIQEHISSKKVTFIINKNYSKGLSTSIVCGITSLQKKDEVVERVLILLADQPAINVEYLKNLLHFSDKNPTKIFASKYPKNLGVSAGFPKEFFHELATLEGDSGAKEFLQQHKEQVIFTDFNAILIDLDTKDDYEKYIKHLKTNQSS